MNINNNNNNQEENQNQFVDNGAINHNFLYNNEELNYASKYTRLTISFLIIFLIKLFFSIYFYTSHNTDKFLFHYSFIINYNQYYRCITRYFINYGFCHFFLEIIILFIMCYHFENMLGTLFTIFFIFISLILISFVNLGLLELTKYIFQYANHKNNLDIYYEGGFTPLLFTLYTFYFSFEGNNNKIFFLLIIFIVKAKHSEYLLVIILIFFTPNNSIFGNISGIFTAYLLKALRLLVLPRILWIKEIENILHLHKIFPLYRFINKANPIMYNILGEYDNNALSHLNNSDEIENGQQMTELTLLSSENGNINHSYN